MDERNSKILAVCFDNCMLFEKEQGNVVGAVVNSTQPCEKNTFITRNVNRMGRDWKTINPSYNWEQQ